MGSRSRRLLTEPLHRGPAQKWRRRRPALEPRAHLRPRRHSGRPGGSREDRGRPMSAAPAPGAAAQAPLHDDDTARPVGSNKWTPYALLAPGMLWLAVFFLIPTVMLLYMSLSSGTAFSGDGS